MKKQAILILDFGTSNVRAILSLARTGEIVDKARRMNHWTAPKDGWAEMDSCLLWENAQDVVEDIIGKDIADYEILGIGFSFFGDSLILTDERLNPLYPMVMAFDSRAYKEAVELEEMIGKDRFEEITGCPSLAMLTCSKILWFRHHMPELFQKTRYFLNIQEYIFGKLGIGLWTDYTLANRKKMMDIRKKEWSQELIKAVGIKKEQLGEAIGDSDQQIGVISHFGRVKLPYKCKVILGAHDAECGSVGLGVIPGQNHTVGNVSGTYEMLGNFLETKSDIGVLENGCGLKKDQMNVCGASIAGSYVSWFRKLTGNQTETFFEEMEEKVRYEGNNSVFFLTDPQKGKFLIDGMSTKTSDVQLYQAVIEGITFKLKSILLAMEQNQILGSDHIIAGGGGASSDRWLQLKADLFQKKVCRTKNQEVSALGAAMITGVGVGIYKDLEAAAREMVQIERVFEPRREIAERYEERYQEYLKKMHLYL